jgi:hypothetical protein
MYPFVMAKQSKAKGRLHKGIIEFRHEPLAILGIEGAFVLTIFKHVHINWDYIRRFLQVAVSVHLFPLGVGLAHFFCQLRGQGICTTGGFDAMSQLAAIRSCILEVAISELGMVMVTMIAFVMFVIMVVRVFVKRDMPIRAEGQRGHQQHFPGEEVVVAATPASFVSAPTCYTLEVARPSLSVRKHEELGL